MFNDIVRDVTDPKQALTTTPDYQSPNGFGAILGGINTGLGNLIDAAMKGGRKGSGDDKDLASAYDYVRSMVNDLDSRPTGPSEKQKIFDDTWVNAVRMFKVDDSDMKNIYEATGMQKYGDVPKNVRQLKLDEETVQQKNVLTLGMAAAPNSSLDVQMQAGSNELARVSNGEVAVKTAALLTPEQQNSIFGKDKAPSTLKMSVKSLVQWGWEQQQYLTPNVPEEAALESYKSQMINYLAQNGINSVSARAVVEDALMPAQIMIYGEDYLKNKDGVKFSRDRSLQAFETTNKIQKEDQISQMMDMTFTGLKDAQGDTMGPISGSQLFTILSQNGSSGSASSVFLSLDPDNMRIIMPQLIAQTRDRWDWKQMKLVLSDQGAWLSNVLADNPDASKALADGAKVATDDLIGSFNAMSDEERKLRNAYWLPANKFIDAYTLPGGQLQSSEVIDAGYTPEAKQAMLLNFFEMIRLGTDYATEENGFYQIDKSGKVHYYGLAGNRMENVFALPGLGRSALSLKDLTDAGRIMQGFDMDAVRMREGIPSLQRGLEILEKAFGFDKRGLVEAFNEYQISRTGGGQRARSIQLLEQAGEGSRWVDRSKKIDMNATDVKAVQDQIAKGLPEAGFSEAQAETITGTIPRSVVNDTMAVGEAVSNAVYNAKDAISSYKKSYQVEAGDSSDTVIQVFDNGFTINIRTPAGITTRLVRTEDTSEQAIKERVARELNIDQNKVSLKTIELSNKKLLKPVVQTRELPTNVSGFEYTGNYDLGDRQVVQNPDGTISTEYSIVIEEDGEYIVIPTVIDGRIVPEEDAVEFYHRTGLNHGKYKSEKEAVKASKEISKIQAKRYLGD